MRSIAIKARIEFLTLQRMLQLKTWLFKRNKSLVLISRIISLWSENRSLISKKILWQPISWNVRSLKWINQNKRGDQWTAVFLTTLKIKMLRDYISIYCARFMFWGTKYMMSRSRSRNLMNFSKINLHFSEINSINRMRSSTKHSNKKKSMKLSKFRLQASITWYGKWSMLSWLCLIGRRDKRN